MSNSRFKIKRLALSSLLAFICGCGGFPSGNSEATRLIEDHWVNGSYDVLPIGEVQIVRSDWSIAKGQASPEDMSAYEVLRQQNAITISSNTDLTSNNNFSWNNWLSLTQEGVIRKMKVNLVSPQENRFQCPEALRKRLGTEKIICVGTGSGQVQEIVRSQKFQIGTKRLWLIMGNHRWKWSDTERKIRDAQKKVSVENMKFMAIAEYEDFTKKWEIGMADYAPRSEPFPKQQAFDNVLSGATPRAGAPPPQ